MDMLNLRRICYPLQFRMQNRITEIFNASELNLLYLALFITPSYRSHFQFTEAQQATSKALVQWNSKLAYSGITHYIHQTLSHVHVRYWGSGTTLTRHQLRGLNCGRAECTWNIPCEWTQVRSKIHSRIHTRCKICIKKRRNIYWSIHPPSYPLLIMQNRDMKLS